MKGYELIGMIRRHFQVRGTAGKPIVFRTEHADFVAIDVDTIDGKTVVMLLEEAK